MVTVQEQQLAPQPEAQLWAAPRACLPAGQSRESERAGTSSRASGTRIRVGTGGSRPDPTSLSCGRTSLRAETEVQWLIGRYSASLPDELDLRPGMKLRVLRLYDDAWGTGQILSGADADEIGKQGAFPIVSLFFPRSTRIAADRCRCACRRGRLSLQEPARRIRIRKVLAGCTGSVVLSFLNTPPVCRRSARPDTRALQHVPLQMLVRQIRQFSWWQ